MADPQPGDKPAGTWADHVHKQVQDRLVQDRLKDQNK